MKKLFVMMSLLVLCGCTRVNEISTSSETNIVEEQVLEEDRREHTLECSKDDESVTFYAIGDQAKQQKQSFDLPYEIDGDLNQEELLNAINSSLASTYETVEGVDAYGALEDGHVRVTVTIDFDQADIQSLVNAGLLYEGELDTKYVSLAKTEAQLKADGYACTVH